ncbi:hypothetical protein M885DRAFT_517311 [Pelagophyceae sp. CCMP2097]|nr:hypothetical protein M885DRAFT_517311 [Pelagophyceae sp. CCMP2097]
MSTLARVVQQQAVKRGKMFALLSPYENVRLTYQQLENVSRKCAMTLQSKYRVERGDAILSDLPNVVANLVLQLACSRLGAAYATAKNVEAARALCDRVAIKATVSADHETWADLDDIPRLPHDEIVGDADVALVGSDDYFCADDGANVHSYFGGVALSSQRVVDLGRGTAERLYIDANDKSCVSITLCHSFGIGNAVAGTFHAGGKVLLPAVGGIRGCGNPLERASATFASLKDAQCTLLFADTHTLNALPDVPPGAEHENDLLPLFRGGVCKVGSGEDFLDLDHVKYYAGAPLIALGKKKVAVVNEAAA